MYQRQLKKQHETNTVLETLTNTLNERIIIKTTVVLYKTRSPTHVQKAPKQTNVLVVVCFIVSMYGLKARSNISDCKHLLCLNAPFLVYRCSNTGINHLKPSISCLTMFVQDIETYSAFDRFSNDARQGSGNSDSQAEWEQGKGIWIGNSRSTGSSCCECLAYGKSVLRARAGAAQPAQPRQRRH